MRKLFIAALLVAAGTINAGSRAGAGYTLEIIGLAHFYDTAAGTGLILVPDGRTSSGGIPSHAASFYVETARIVRTEGWPATRSQVLDDIGVSELAIAKPSTITISGLDASVDSAVPEGRNHRLTMPRLKEIDPEFRIVLDKAETVARIPIGRATPEAFSFGGSVAARLRVAEHSGPITITATADDGSETRSVTLRAGTEIVFGNLPVAFTKHAHTPEASHFRLYAKLDVNRRADKLVEPPVDPRLEPLPWRHPYLRHLLGSIETVPRPGCSNTCCAPSPWP